jgi:menaquinone-dependent protoporphyrinogen oxidase
MKRVLVLYATMEGQSLKVAQHATQRLREAGFSVRTLDVDDLGALFSLRDYLAVLLVAPVHMSLHPRSMCRFVSEEREELAKLPALFLSLSLSQAGVELTSATPQQRERASADVQYLIKRFCEATGFPSRQVVPIAGCLAYSQYGFFKRLVMKRIAKKAGGSTDTSRDHEYTNYALVDAAVDRLTAGLVEQAAATA